MAGGPFPCGCCCRVCDDMADAGSPTVWTFDGLNTVDQLIGYDNAEHSGTFFGIGIWYYWSAPSGISSFLNFSIPIQFPTPPTFVNNTFVWTYEDLLSDFTILLNYADDDNGGAVDKPPAGNFQTVQIRFSNIRRRVALVQAMSGHTSLLCRTRFALADILADIQITMAAGGVSIGSSTILLKSGGGGQQVKLSCAVSATNKMRAHGRVSGSEIGTFNLSTGSGHTGTVRPPWNSPLPQFELYHA